MENQGHCVLFFTGESKDYLGRDGLEMSKNMLGPTGLWILGFQVYMNQGWICGKRCHQVTSSTMTRAGSHFVNKFDLICKTLFTG